MEKLSPLLWILIILFIAGCSEPKNEQGFEIFGGAAKINITPERPIRMTGYGGRKDPYSGVHDSLYASAMVFSDGQIKATIIATDLIGFSHSFCDETRDMIESETGIPKANILLSAAHNHAGPTTIVYMKNPTIEEEYYIKGMQLKIVEIVKEASQNLQPVKIGYGKGICNMNINRRAPMADGSIWLGRNPDGPCDRDVAVVRMDDLDNNPLAVFVNWPCHGVVGNSKNTYISGDWPGATARFIEKELGNEVVVPVTAGASADINPLYHSDNFEEIDATGMILGREVVDILKNINTSGKGTIKCIEKTVVAKGKKRLDSRQPKQKLQAKGDEDINLSVLKIGSILFVGISGELFTEIGMDIKKESPEKNTIIVTHCNGSSGYLCTDKSYPEGGYEIMVTRTMPGTESLIRENLFEMIHSISE